MTLNMSACLLANTSMIAKEQSSAKYKNVVKKFILLFLKELIIILRLSCWCWCWCLCWCCFSMAKFRRKFLCFDFSFFVLSIASWHNRFESKPLILSDDMVSRFAWFAKHIERTILRMLWKIDMIWYRQFVHIYLHFISFLFCFIWFSNARLLCSVWICASITI